MSFIGARLSHFIHNLNHSEVISLEDAINIAPNTIQWYRWTQLHMLGVSQLSFVDFTNGITLENCTVNLNIYTYYVV